MFAVVTTVELPEGRSIDEGRQMLESGVLPRLRSATGFVSAVFVAPKTGREGLSVVVFDSEANADAGMQAMQPPPGVRMIHQEVREVAATA